MSVSQDLPAAEAAICETEKGRQRILNFVHV